LWANYEIDLLGCMMFRMNRVFILLTAVVVFTGCASAEEVPEVVDDAVDVVEEEVSSERYVLFTINTQEFFYHKESVETLNRLLDLHEEYDLPVDIYLTEDVFRVYEKEAPDLVDRFKDSDLVAISYHYRPPHPYHLQGDDFLGLAEMKGAELREVLESYVNFATDSVTGEVTEEVGGPAHIADVIGYAPIITGMSASKSISESFGKLMKDLGTTFAVTHGGEPKLGDTRFSLFVRPEDLPIITGQWLEEDPAVVIRDMWEEQGDSGFMNIKVHDNDFIADASAWTAIYIHRSPPYNLEHGTTERSLLTEEESDEYWDFYEGALKEVSADPEFYHAINAFDLKAMVEEL
jgi:hypothetical protein